MAYLFVSCGGLAALDAKRCTSVVEEVAAENSVGDAGTDRLIRALVWRECMERRDYSCDEFTCTENSGSVNARFNNPYR